MIVEWVEVTIIQLTSFLIMFQEKKKSRNDNFHLVDSPARNFIEFDKIYRRPSKQKGEIILMFLAVSRLRPVDSLKCIRSSFGSRSEGRKEKKNVITN